MVQYAIMVKQDDVCARVAQVHSPMIPLPCANWATLRARKDGWALWSGAEVGDNFLPDAADADETGLADVARAIPASVKLDDRCCAHE